MRYKITPVLIYFAALIIVLSSCGNNLKNATIENAESAKNTCIDVDGNIYHSVTIGKQIWMVENLAVTHYRNGDEIPNIPDSQSWSNATTGAYCNFNNDINIAEKYGKLYNWFAVHDDRNIAPKGWHVPTDAEWNILEKYLDNTVDTTVAGSGSVGTDIGNKLKEKGTTNWNDPNKNATNSSGFTALLGGSRLSIGIFGKIGEYGHWWCSTEYSGLGISSGRCRDLYYHSKEIGRGNGRKEIGFSVRCIKD